MGAWCSVSLPLCAERHTRGSEIPANRLTLVAAEVERRERNTTRVEMRRWGGEAQSKPSTNSLKGQSKNSPLFHRQSPFPA